jgi:hypothetical protein
MCRPSDSPKPSYPPIGLALTTPYHSPIHSNIHTKMFAKNETETFKGMFYSTKQALNSSVTKRRCEQ